MTHTSPSTQPAEPTTDLLTDTGRRYAVAQRVLADVAGLAQNAADEDFLLTPDEVAAALTPFTALEAAAPAAAPALREQAIRERLDAASEGPWFVSDCEGRLQVWREGALEHVVRDESGTITGWSTPFSWTDGDLLHEVDLETWDEGSDPDEDLERANARLMGHAPQDLEYLLDETTLLRRLLAETVDAYNALAARKQRTEQQLQQLRTESGHSPGEVI
ncbi:hypothetical protein [Streptomyces sp. H27-C3]|uniref:hypothetical protein n=1 Tax=Streptomyces sp. H27-C3 TaxID=3046305 RepID=UPI0024BB797B|nr:hypothetical protein [Streptomyces sp. H27-C3]MDJ0466089.1 hypothetical protein [Streptomyces sp. H27-C3]